MCNEMSVKLRYCKDVYERNIKKKFQSIILSSDDKLSVRTRKRYVIKTLNRK